MPSRRAPFTQQQPGDEEARQHEERVEREHTAGGEVAGVHRDREPDGEASPAVERGPVCAAGARRGGHVNQEFDTTDAVGWAGRTSVEHEDRHILAAGGRGAGQPETEPPGVEAHPRRVAALVAGVRQRARRTGRRLRRRRASRRPRASPRPASEDDEVADEERAGSHRVKLSPDLDVPARPAAPDQPDDPGAEQHPPDPDRKARGDERRGDARDHCRDPGSVAHGEKRRTLPVRDRPVDQQRGGSSARCGATTGAPSPASGRAGTCPRALPDTSQSSARGINSTNPFDCSTTVRTLRMHRSSGRRALGARVGSTEGSRCMPVVPIRTTGFGESCSTEAGARKGIFVGRSVDGANGGRSSDAARTAPSPRRARPRRRAVPDHGSARRAPRRPRPRSRHGRHRPGRAFYAPPNPLPSAEPGDLIWSAPFQRDSRRPCVEGALPLTRGRRFRRRGVRRDRRAHRCRASPAVDR